MRIFLLCYHISHKKKTPENGEKPPASRRLPAVRKKRGRKEVPKEAAHGFRVPLYGFMISAAFELADFGVWTDIIRSVVYEGLYMVGNAVLNGTFHQRPAREKK